MISKPICIEISYRAVFFVPLHFVDFPNFMFDNLGRFYATMALWFKQENICAMYCISQVRSLLCSIFLQMITV